MNWLVLSCLVGLAGFSAAAEKYSDAYDYINIDEILDNKKLLVNYLKCILDQGRCTVEGKELKMNIKDGIQTACEKCTKKQREGSRKMVKHVRAHEPQYWVQLKAMYDPENKFADTYEAFLARDD